MPLLHESIERKRKESQKNFSEVFLNQKIWIIIKKKLIKNVSFQNPPIVVIPQKDLIWYLIYNKLHI